jgi:hypothetical protein
VVGIDLEPVDVGVALAGTMAAGADAPLSRHHVDPLELVDQHHAVLIQHLQMQGGIGRHLGRE